MCKPPKGCKETSSGGKLQESASASPCRCWEEGPRGLNLGRVRGQGSYGAHNSNAEG